ncbi:uncharacterized protein MONOS_18341 [Monocercomonoides exilis]|uniref:uncharacterized protein n=1 Tax=Monocercomonoides exilis TaxID=2049356 RepID=UPI00355A0CDD|nr:hypothetical protein MONOS_18341 [Monocercomonoides exilis]
MFIGDAAENNCKTRTSGKLLIIQLIQPFLLLSPQEEKEAPLEKIFVSAYNTHERANHKCEEYELSGDVIVIDYDGLNRAIYSLMSLQQEEDIKEEERCGELEDVEDLLKNVMRDHFAALVVVVMKSMKKVA